MKVNAKFANVPAIKNKLCWHTGTGLAMEDTWKLLEIDWHEYIQEMTPLWGTRIVHMTFGGPLKAYSSLTDSRVVHWSF